MQHDARPARFCGADITEFWTDDDGSERVVQVDIKTYSSRDTSQYLWVADGFARGSMAGAAASIAGNKQTRGEQEPCQRAIALYRKVQILLPMELRQEFDDELTQVFLDGCRDHHGHLWRWVAIEALKTVCAAAHAWGMTLWRAVRVVG